MSKQTRRKFTSEFKAQVALEASKNQYTLVELSKKFDVSPVVISKWKGAFLESGPAIILVAAASRTNRIELTSAVAVLSATDPVRVFSGICHPGSYLKWPGRNGGRQRIFYRGFSIISFESEGLQQAFL